MTHFEGFYCSKTYCGKNVATGFKLYTASRATPYALGNTQTSWKKVKKRCCRDQDKKTKKCKRYGKCLKKVLGITTDGFQTVNGLIIGMKASSGRQGISAFQLGLVSKKEAEALAKETNTE